MMMRNNRRFLKYLTGVFTVALIVNGIIGGSAITMAVMAVSALYAVYISFKIDKERGDYE